MDAFWKFASLLLVALILVPAGAHLAEMPRKMSLAAADYLTVQQIYMGWALFGFVVVAALVATAGLALTRWRAGEPFGVALAAFVCVALTQVVFWTWTQPANRATSNWTQLPGDWLALRVQWEYSHAASALLTLAALVLLIRVATARS